MERPLYVVWSPKSAALDAFPHDVASVNNKLIDEELCVKLATEDIVVKDILRGEHVPLVHVQVPGEAEMVEIDDVDFDGLRPQELRPYPLRRWSYSTHRDGRSSSSCQASSGSTVLVTSCVCKLFCVNEESDLVATFCANAGPLRSAGCQPSSGSTVLVTCVCKQLCVNEESEIVATFCANAGPLR